MKVLVTGATGNVGQAVVQHLIECKVPLRATTSKPVQNGCNKDSIEWVSFDFNQRHTFQEALQDVNVVVLVRPPHMGDAKAFKPFIQAMKEASIELVIFLSLMGIESNPQAPHFTIERLLRESGMNTCMVRPGFFMQNLTGVHLQEILEEDCIFIPAKMSRCSFVDAEDVGIAIATIASQPASHLNTHYTLTGSESLNYCEVAEKLTCILGRKISYKSPNGFHYFMHMWVKRKLSVTYILVTIMLYFITQKGISEAVTNDFEQLPQQRPRTIEAFFSAHQKRFAN